MRNKSLFVLCGCFIMIALLSVSCGKKEEEKAVAKKEVAQAKVYKLGLSLAITGPTSDAGNPYSKGVEDYFRYVNDMKLLGEDKIECEIRDDQYKTDVTKRNFEDFISQGIVFYLNYSTGSTLALKKDFEDVKMPTIPASFHAGNLIDSHYIFHKRVVLRYKPQSDCRYGQLPRR